MKVVLILMGSSFHPPAYALSYTPPFPLLNLAHKGDFFAFLLSPLCVALCVREGEQSDDSVWLGFVGRRGMITLK